ncbi:DUF1851 domain-containing protein [Acidovorax sp. GBBC 3334]|uniref:T6SS immunity protein Tdi1 domain-containing protein n=1 Tax=Acidovorax sp. GBBC 3334 TaxID=2940496 RepID=UPI002303797B|nr:T6SS immunity protein Tdi1 domain-containing protein [Acidovorax sp. GBBC 3334]MDA8456973.1 DUF1851 domain-containing protein [Acidovorax sp. GBBC 3334]
MYEKFRAVFFADFPRTNSAALLDASIVDPKLVELFGVFGGCSFNKGLYRVLRADQISYWNDLVGSAFPDFKERIKCFSVDWLGRIFAIDTARIISGRPAVTLFEPGTGEALEIPCDVEGFHESEIVDYQEAALAEKFHREWLDGGGGVPSFDQCVGYKRPLFLGGKDDLKNLELSNLEVYWVVAAQLISAVKGVPQGKSIGKVFFD